MIDLGSPGCCCARARGPGALVAADLATAGAGLHLCAPRPRWPRRGRLHAHADADVDALLVERAKRGDKAAFEMLVVKYQRRIERLISRMVRDVDLVQDIAQETFIRAYRALPQFRGDSAFYTWLYRIAINTAKKALVDLKRDPLVSESFPAARVTTSDETSRVENELSDGETPEACWPARRSRRR
jgi:hypothetical protein